MRRNVALFKTGAKVASQEMRERLRWTVGKTWARGSSRASLLRAGGPQKVSLSPPHSGNHERRERRWFTSLWEFSGKHNSPLPPLAGAGLPPRFARWPFPAPQTVQLTRASLGSSGRLSYVPRIRLKTGWGTPIRHKNVHGTAASAKLSY